MQTVLVVVRSPTERETIRKALTQRNGFEVASVLTSLAAARALVERTVDVMIASAELSTLEVGELIEMLERVRPGLPLLVLRGPQADEPSHWSKPEVGVMRTPFWPDTLVRTVETIASLGARRRG